MAHGTGKNINWWVFTLIGVNFLLWNILMPVFEPADESGHYAHILYIWKQGQLPNLVELPPTEKGVGYTTYPPLYYWTLIPLAKLIDAPLESEELLPYHPQKELFKKSVFSVYLHTRDELFFRWNNLARAVHLLRLQTSIYGFLTVYLVYLTGKKMFGENSRKPLLAAALVGLNPMFAHISNSIVNVNLNILLFSLFFYLAVRSFVNFSNFSAVKFAKLNFVLGVITGVAYLSKITGLMLIPIWIVFTICHLYRFLVKPGMTSGFRVPPGMTFRSILTFFAGFMLIAGWYLARNIKLYGSLLETEAAIKHFGRPAMQLEMSGPINYWTGFIQTNFKTLFSGYGMVTVNLPDGILFLLLIILLIGIWGILIRIGKIRQVILYRFRIKSGMTMELFLIASAILIILGHVVVNINVEAFHARDLFVGIIPFSLLFVLGAETWWKKFKTGQFWNYKLINLLMISLIYILTIFHFQQPELVAVAKSLVLQQGINLWFILPIVKLTLIFGLALWLLKKSRLPRSACGEARNDGKREAGDKGISVYWLTGGLFAANLAILFILVIPRLYRL